MQCSTEKNIKLVKNCFIHIFYPDKKACCGKSSRKEKVVEEKVELIKDESPWKEEIEQLGGKI